jgi:hypothetical protein
MPALQAVFSKLAAGGITASFDALLQAGLLRLKRTY